MLCLQFEIIQTQKLFGCTIINHNLNLKTMNSISFLYSLFLLLVCCPSCIAQYIEKNSDFTHGISVLDKTQFAPFDTDIRDDCRDLLEHCQSGMFGHVYLQCPGLCTKFLEQEGFVGTAHDDPDALYEAGTLRTFQNNGGRRVVDSDRFEGYVLVFAVVPLLPGMAVYYYELMAHLHSVFTPKAEFVLLPIDLGHEIHLKIREKENGKVVVFDEEPADTVTETHPWVKHLSSIKPRSGLGTTDHGDGVTVEQRALHLDRVSVYVVSADGYFVEQLIVPSMSKLKEKIRMYAKTMDYEL